MFILKAIPDPIQSELKKTCWRGQLFTSEPLPILFLLEAARISHVFRIVSSSLTRNRREAIIATS